MSDLSLIPLEDWFETQLAQDWNGAVGTVYVLDTPSYTPTTTNTYIVVNPWKTNMQIAEITDYDSTANTLTVSNVTLLKGLGINSTAPASSHATGSKVIISDNYQFWADIQTSINSKLDKNGNNGVTYATTAARDSALGADGVATLPYRNIYVTATGLFYNYNLSANAWQSIDTGTSPANATASVSGLVRTDVAPAGIPVALITDNPKYDALAGNNTDIAVGTGNLFVTQTGLQKNAESYAATATGNDTYVITLSPVPTSLVNGMRLKFKADVANTGAATLNVNSLGAVSLVTGLSTALATGDIVANQVVEVVYNSTWPVFQVLNPASAILAQFVPVSDTLTFSRDISTASGTQVINHNLGRVPKNIIISAIWVLDLGGSTTTKFSNGWYDGTTNNCVTSFMADVGAGLSDSFFTIFSSTSYSRAYSGAITAWDSTTFTITWTKTGSPTGNIYIFAKLNA